MTSGSTSPEAGSGDAPQRLRCLLAEDDDLLGPVLRSMLEALGYEVHAVACGRAALDVLERKDFDVVVTDYRMPLGNGVDVLRAVRRRSPDCPVIVISGYADEGVEAEIRDAGGRLLHKPFGATELRTVLTELVPAR